MSQRSLKVFTFLSEIHRPSSSSSTSSQIEGKSIMIRQRRLSSNWRFQDQNTRIELSKIFSISRRELTINEIKLWRLRDMTHYICPFKPSHQYNSPLEMINHITTCMTSSIHGLNGEDARKLSNNWMICKTNSDHLFDKDFEKIHCKLHDRCETYE